MSSRGGRQPSGPWGRLKPVNIDPLESLGLPSKGDNRLLDHKTQERYYSKIVDRYMSFCSHAGRSDELLRRFSALQLTSEDGSNGKPLVMPSSASNQPGSSHNKSEGDSEDKFQRDLSVLIMALRKLREGIVASKRIDDFAIQAYIFGIRLSILVKHMESYHPALLHLLNEMHSAQSLSAVDLQEFVGYLVLDLACRQEDLAQAHVIRCQFSLKDSKVDAVLSAMAHENYHLFWLVKRSVDGHKAKLMEFAEAGMRLHALKCLARTYFTVERTFVEGVTNSTWATLKADNHVGWELQGSSVIIRKPKGK